MLKIKNLNISYQRRILEDVEFYAKKNTVTLIKGESGSGKTSLLYRIALLSNQKDYIYSIDDLNIMKYSDSQKAKIRRNYIAYVLQDSLLIEHYNLRQNLEYSAKMVREELSEREIKLALQDVELDISLDREISTLSGGERQRLALACALVKNCEIIVLDEPTGSLNEELEINIFKLIHKLAHNKGKCIIMASHSSIANEYSDIIYQIDNRHLNCLKDSQNNEKIILEEKDYKVKFKFLFEYVKDYLRVFKKKWMATVTITSFSFLLIFLTLIGIEFLQKESQQSLLSTSDNQIYISTVENGKNTKINNTVLSQYNINDVLVKEKESILTSYPYIYAQAKILTKKIDIIPYFKENNLKEKYKELYNYLEDGPILSYETAQLLKRNNISSKFLDIDISIRIDKEGKTLHEEERFSYDVKGILKEGENNHYSDNNYYIYVPYEYLQSFSTKHGNQEYIGYTLFANDFQDHLQLNDNLKKYNLSVNDTFQNTLGLDNVMKSTQNMKNIMLLVIVVGTIAILSLMSIHKFGLRKREFVLSIITGLSYKNIITIGLIENIIQNLVSLIIFLSISLVMLVFLMDKMQIFMQVIFIVCVEIILINLVIFILNYLQMRKLSIEDVLRK